MDTTGTPPRPLQNSARRILPRPQPLAAAPQHPSSLTVAHPRAHTIGFPVASQSQCPQTFRLLQSPTSTGYEDRFSEIEDLRRSHSVLSQRVDDLVGDVRSSINAAETAQRTRDRDLQVSRDAYVLRRITMFAGCSLSKVLLGRTRELFKTLPHLYAANSVRQIVLRSKPLDCSLHEFRVFARACSQNQDISCAFFPSPYIVINLTACQTNHLRIVFPTYSNFCVALGIDLCTRKAGLFRQRIDKLKSVRAVQIIGIEQVQSSGISSSSPQRRIFPGIGGSDAERNVPHPCLLQSNTTWSECSWESGFTLSEDTPPTKSPQRRDSSENICSRSSYRRPEQCGYQENDNVFSVSWKKTSQPEISSGLADEFSLGALRSTIPAVVLRGRLLTTSTETVFNAPVNGRFLTDILTSNS